MPLPIDRLAYDPEASLNIQIRTQPLAGPSLVRDYLAGEGAATSFYAGSPRSRAAFADKLAEVQGRFGRPERELAARALRPTSPRAKERLERFVREGGAVVTTGQQAGVLTGPLYTIYKALTVYRLAEALEAELGVIVLPVFWTASEDHDWAEVNHAYLVDDGDRVRRVQLRSTDSRTLPMDQRVLGSEVKRFLDEVADLLDRQPFADHLLHLIRASYTPERTVSSAFSAMLGDLLGPFDVLLTDAADPHLKRASGWVLRQAIEQADQHSTVLRQRSGQLLEKGYHAQVAVLEDATNVFYHGAGERERIDRHAGGFVLHDSRRTLQREALLEEVENYPERFSPNVFLRPVVESAVFPTLSYVGGPGEISYFAQLNALFPQFGIRPPVISPRFSVTLVEPSIQRLLGKLGLTASDLAGPRHELATRLAREAMPPGVRASLDDLAAAVSDGYRRLIGEAGAIDPTLAGALGALRNESLARVGESERKIVQRIKQKEVDMLAQLDRVTSHLQPERQPQERVLNVASYLARYGPDLLRRIAAELEIAWDRADAARTGHAVESAV